MSILCEHQHDFLLQMQVRRRRTGSGLAHFWECRLNALELPSGTADRPFRIIVLTANDRSLKPRRHVLGISILTWCELNLTADISIKSLRQCYSTEYTYTSYMVVVTIVARMTSLTPLYLYLLLYVRVDCVNIKSWLHPARRSQYSYTLLCIPGCPISGHKLSTPLRLTGHRRALVVGPWRPCSHNTKSKSHHASMSSHRPVTLCYETVPGWP